MLGTLAGCGLETHPEAPGLGYEIEAGPKGYRLLGSPDALYPWEFPGREERVVYHPEVSSTMDIAKEMARGGCPDFTAVVAGRQTAGRGRLRRVWRSNAGGLYFTLVLRPRIPVPLSGRVNFLASLTLARLLREGYGVEAGLKWPNDILVSGRKLCGLLSEMEAEGRGGEVREHRASASTSTTTSRGCTGRGFPQVGPGPRACRAGSCWPASSTLSRRPSGPRTGMRSSRSGNGYSATLGRPVRIVTAREEASGIAEDVDENGALILRQADGTVRTIIYGDCFIQN